MAMDKIFSVRVDESVIRLIGHLARLLQTSKKQVVEESIEMFASRIEKQSKADILDRTHGAWKRQELPEATVKKSREAFRASMKRHAS
jgi:hypothetical protein